MKDVEGTVTSCQGIRTRKPSCFHQHDRQVAGRHDQAPGFTVHFKGGEKMGDLRCGKKFAPTRKAQGILQLEFIEDGKRQRLGKFSDVGQGLGRMKITSVERKKEARIATDRFHDLKTSLTIGTEGLRLRSGQNRQSFSLHQQNRALRPINLLRPRLFRYQARDDLSPLADGDLLSRLHPPQNMAILVAEFTHSRRFHCATNM